MTARGRPVRVRARSVFVGAVGVSWLALVGGAAPAVADDPPSGFEERALDGTALDELAVALRAAGADETSPAIQARCETAARRLEALDVEFVGRAARWLAVDAPVTRKLDTVFGRAAASAAASAAALDDERVADGARHALAAVRAMRAAIRTSSAALRRADARTGRWTTVLEHRGGAFMSIWVGPSAAPEAWLVGGADAAGPQILRFDGATWRRVPVGGEFDLWWIDEVPGDGFWTSGTEGSVLHVDPATETVSDRSPPLGGTYFGIWGADPQNVWTVGVGDTGGARLYHWDGAAWTAPELPESVRPRGLLKIWGRSADDVYVCGIGGTLIRWNGATWAAVELPAIGGGTVGADLLTVHGDARRVIAVGRVFGATIVQADGSGFAEVRTPPLATSISGVFVPPRGDVWAVGYFGNVLRRRRGAWTDVTDARVPEATDLHSVRIDDTGGVWVSGGDLLRGEQGLLLHYGPRRPSGVVDE